MKTGDSSNLNLLPSQAKFQATRMKLQENLKKYMSFVIVLWVVVVLLMVVVYFGSGYVLTVQNNKYKQALSDFQGNSEEVIVNQLLKYRTKVLGQVLKDRYEYSVAFKKINLIFEDRVKLSTFELDKDKNFMVKVIATDKESLDFVEKKVSLANSGELEGIKAITINSASNTVVNGFWTVTMGVILK